MAPSHKRYCTIALLFSPISEHLAQALNTAIITPVILTSTGRVSEWSMETVLKTVVPAMVPWVRIPPLPPSDLIC